MVHLPCPAADAIPAATSLECVEEEGQALGFCAIGVTSGERLMEDGQRLRAWLALGHHGSMGYLAGVGRDEPQQLLGCVRSVISVAVACSSHETLVSGSSTGPSGRVGAYALGPDYHGFLKERLREFADRLALRFRRPVVARPCVDTAPLLERGVAVRAGLGFVGKNTLLIVPGVGSGVVLGELLLDVELPHSLPKRHRCGDCRACLDACPTGALVRPYVLDARRCVSYLTIEHRGFIPRDLRAGIGSWVFGCDRCQRACPWNRASKAERENRPTLGKVGGDCPTTLGLVDLLEQRSGEYKRLVKGTVLARVSRVQLARNAAVALGNSGSPAAIEPLLSALQAHASAIVRGHAAWALGRLGAAESRAPLAHAAASDPDPAVRAECHSALRDLDGAVSVVDEGLEVHQLSREERTTDGLAE